MPHAFAFESSMLVALSSERSTSQVQVFNRAGGWQSGTNCLLQKVEVERRALCICTNRCQESELDTLQGQFWRSECILLKVESRKLKV